ncbi:MAG: 3-hydroxybutyryl-CoA dehydrogenase, partial [bacterium]|nr:3-hydroxybutyryl-CoA dehydrogenase [bacterium]
MNIQTVGVLGAGVMGSDVALDLACYGYTVLLKDIQDDVITQADAKIRQDFKLVKMMKKEVKPLSIDDILAKITFTTTYDGFERVDLVIENVVEDWEVKKQAYLELQKACRADALYAVNTSCISITKVGSLMPTPENVIGMHFMNPVPMKALVEVIRGHYTSDVT